jgi:DNA-directed RNA polymerase specialized sigma24 family protein
MKPGWWPQPVAATRKRSLRWWSGYPQVRGLCARMLGDPDLAADMAQEAVVTALLNLSRLRHDDRFGPWLAGIGLNLCRRLLRAEGRPVYSLDVLTKGSRIADPVEQDRAGGTRRSRRGRPARSGRGRDAAYRPTRRRGAVLSGRAHPR